MRRTSSVQDAASRADVETRATDDHHDALRLWLRLLATTTLVEATVRKRLKIEFGTTLPRFDLMAQLERAPEGLKMGELSRRMMVTGGNVTGITDSLEREGLVSRIGDPHDRRASRVRLTATGRRTFASMARAHEAWIVSAFAALDEPQLKTLGVLLGRVKAHLTAQRKAAR